MRITVAEIIKREEITFKDGGVGTKLLFKTTDGKVLDSFAKLEAGKEYDGEINTDSYGEHFKRTPMARGGGRPGFQSDPRTMIIAYAKDLVVALVAAGAIKDPEQMAKQWSNFSLAGFKILERGQETPAPAQVQAKVHLPDEEPPESPEDDINIEDVPF